MKRFKELSGDAVVGGGWGQGGQAWDRWVCKREGPEPWEVGEAHRAPI